MAIKIPTEAEIWLSRVFLGITTAPALEMALFSNDLTPDDDTEVGDFTEADFDGYAPIALTGGTVDPTPDGDGAIVWTFDDVVFAHDGGATANTIHGYWIRDAGSPSKWFWCERSPGPVTMANLGDTETISPIFRFRQRP